MPEFQKTARKFIDCHVNLRSSLSESQLNAFKALKTNRNRILFIINLEKRPQLEIKLQKHSGKNIEEAKKMKNTGNVYFQKENYIVALSFYSQAILKSSQLMPEVQEELSVFYANRSAALYHLKKYTLSIRDINFAIKLGYPQHLKHKVLDRKSRCYLALEKYQLAFEFFQQTISALDDAKLPVDKQQKWQKDIQIMLLMISKNKRLPKSTTTNETKNETKMKGKRNAQYEALTSVIDIKCSEELGRFAVAKADIKAGEVVVIEDAHCAVLLQKYRGTNCLFCFRRVELPEVCPTCDLVRFCSHECKDAAMLSFHGIECSIETGLWESDISVTCMMALRIITQRTLQYFLEKRNTIFDVRSQGIPKLKSTEYESVHNLVTHEGRRKGEDLLNRAHMAVFILDYLRNTNYFEEKAESENIINAPYSDIEIYIAELILHHLQVLQFNAHEVSEVQVKNGNIEASSSEFIGGALFPTLALFNHSCNPSVIRYFEGTRVIAVTIQNIKAEQMVSENYGPLFTEVGKEERQRTLNEQYWFQCTCEACTLDWPNISKMNQLQDIRLRCTNRKCGNAINIDPKASHFMIKCHECSQNVNMFKPLKALQESDDKFAMARNLLKMKKTKKALEEFLKLLNLLDEHLVPPYKDYYLCLQAIRTCYLFKGNVFFSLEN